MNPHDTTRHDTTAGRAPVMHRSTRVLVAPFRSFLPNARSSLAYVWGIPAGPGLMSEQAERACSSRCALHGLHQQYNRLHGLGTAQYNRLHQQL